MLKNIRKVSLVCCLFVCFIVLVSGVVGGTVGSPSWSLVGSSGTWTTNTVGHVSVVGGWDSDEDWDSHLNFSSGSISDFSGWALNYTVNDFLAVKRQTLYLTGYLDMVFGVQLVRADGTYAVGRFLLTASANLFNTSSATQMYLGAYGTHYVPAVGGENGYDNFGVRVFTSDSAVTFSYEYWMHTPSDVASSDINVWTCWNETFPLDFFRETVTVKLFFAWSGSGTIDLTSNADMVADGGSQVPNVGDGGADATEVQNYGLLQFLYALPSTIMGYLGFIPLLVAFGVPLLIIAPSLFILAVMQSGMSSIEEGGFQPLTNLAMKIWELGSSVIGMVVGAFQFIVDFFKP